MIENEIIEKVIRVDKANASFVYFILESNEGLSFYSTKESSKNSSYRDISINYSKDFSEQMEAIIDLLAQKFNLQFL